MDIVKYLNICWFSWALVGNQSGHASSHSPTTCWQPSYLPTTTQAPFSYNHTLRKSLPLKLDHEKTWKNCLFPCVYDMVKLEPSFPYCTCETYFYLQPVYKSVFTNHRKICMNCRCGKDDHEVEDDDQDIGKVVIGKLFDRPARTKKEELEFSYGWLQCLVFILATLTPKFEYILIILFYFTHRSAVMQPPSWNLTGLKLERGRVHLSGAVTVNPTLEN